MRHYNNFYMSKRRALDGVRVSGKYADEFTGLCEYEISTFDHPVVLVFGKTIVGVTSRSLSERELTFASGHEYAFLILEATDICSGFNELQVSCINVGIMLLLSHGMSETIEYLKSLISGDDSLPGVPKGQALILHILGQLPGVGRIEAQRLLQRFGTIRNIFIASEDDLSCVHGIGKIKAALIYKALNSPFIEQGRNDNE